MTNISTFRNATTKQLTTYSLEKKRKTIDVPRGKKITLGEVKGHGCLKQLWLTFPGWFFTHWEPSAAVSQTILKTLILRIYWDGSEKPAVQCPIGDFFGNGLCETSNFASKYFGMSSGGFFCKFPMPFKKGFRIEIENMDEKIDTDIFMNVLYQIEDSPPENAGYFHTQFRTDRSDGPTPAEIADISGNGHFAGCIVSMQSKDHNHFSCLEAPEYIYIDDDVEKPTIVGTGLEDYFLGGWYFREGEFIGELNGVPSKDSLNSSVVMYRVHDEDAIRFKERLNFKFENKLSTPKFLLPFAYSSAAFYYLDSPEGQCPDIPSREKLLCWYRIKNTDHQSIP